jgi:hypothetical protein
MPADNAAVNVDEVPFFKRFTRKAFDKPGVIAVRDEADILAVLFFRHTDAYFVRHFPKL